VGGRAMGALRAFRPAGADPAGAALAACLRTGAGGGGHPLALVRVPGAPGSSGVFLALEGGAAPRCAAGLPPHVATGAGRITLWSPRKGAAGQN